MEQEKKLEYTTKMLNRFQKGKEDVMGVYMGNNNILYQKKCGTDASRFCCLGLHGSLTKMEKSTNICGIHQSPSGLQSCDAVAVQALFSTSGV